MLLFTFAVFFVLYGIGFWLEAQADGFLIVMYLSLFASWVFVAVIMTFFFMVTKCLGFKVIIPSPY